MHSKKIIIVIFIILCGFTSHSLFADTAESVKRQINDINSQIEALDREIKQYQDKITTTSGEANSLAKIVAELNLTRTKLTKELEQTQKKITATNLVIKNIDEDITDKERTIQQSRLLLGKMFRTLDTYDNITPLERILAEEDISEMTREYNNIIALNEQVRVNIREINKQKVELDITKDKKEVEYKNLSELKQTLTGKKVVIDVTKKEKDTLLSQTKNKESEYKKLLAERQKLKDTFEKELDDYEAKLQFILDPNSLPKAGSGVLSFPVKTPFMTSPFGPRWGRFHYGTDFRAPVGTPVTAMASGTVLGTGDTDLSCKGASFGKWVFIKYDNGLSSTYGHLSAISSKVGQKVKAGDIVAMSGNTGSSTGPHLHVNVYASSGVNVQNVPSKSCNGKIFTQPIAALNAYLDPMLYLPKLPKS